ncbi:MAG: serine hydrolase [Clostridia bacterium]|nr:serine hydrolase [Clostridia bacterium]
MSAIEQTVLSSITREIAALPGQVGFYYKNLVTGCTAGYRENEAFLAASVIKFPLYLHVLTLAHLGNLSMSDKLTTLEEDKVPSCGALTLFTGEVECDIATLCRLMIALSDNTATNRLIRHLGIEEINRGFAEMGLRQTVLRRKLFDTAASARGIQNTICPREMGDLLESLYRGNFLSPAVSREAINTFLLQQIGHKLDGKLCERYPIAHKTGEDDGLTNDVGLILAPTPFILCFAGNHTDVYRFEDLMRRSAYDIAEAL